MDNGQSHLAKLVMSGIVSEKLVKAAEGAHLTERDFLHLISSDGKSALDKITKAFMSIVLQRHAVKKVVPVEIKRVQDVETLLLQGKYDLYDFNKEWLVNRIMDKASVCKEMELNLVGTREVRIICFKRRMPPDLVLSVLESMNYRSASAAELLTVGRDHPALQKKIPMVSIDPGLDEEILKYPFGKIHLYLDYLGNKRRVGKVKNPIFREDTNFAVVKI